MEIFNRKLLVLLIFINYFNNIYIFCGNGVEVEEIGDLQSANGSYQPMNSFNNYNKSTKESDDERTRKSDSKINKRTEKSDDESTQESDGKIHIDGDKHQIIDPTESSPIITEEQDQDKEAGEITNWIKKNKILFSFLSIMAFIGGFFGIKSLVQGLSGKKNKRERGQGGASENVGLQNDTQDDDEEQRKQLQNTQQLSEIEANSRSGSQHAENHQHSQEDQTQEEESMIQQDEANSSQLKTSQENHQQEQSFLDQNNENASQNLENDQNSEEEELKRIQAEATEAERIRIQVEEAAEQERIRMQEAAEQKRILEEAAEAELKKKQEEEKAAAEAKQKEEEQARLIQEQQEKIENMNKTIDLFQDKKMIINFVHSRQDRYSKPLFEKYGYDYLEDTLDFTLPNIDFCKAIIDSNQDSIALLNTRLLITQNWTEFKEDKLDDKDKDVLTFYLSGVGLNIKIPQYLSDKTNKIYSNEQNTIFVEDNIIKGIINKKKNFFISTDKNKNKNIKLYFNNFFFQINSESKILVKYQILKHKSVSNSTIETECHAIILVSEDKSCDITILNNNILDTNYNKSIVEAALKEYNKIATTIIQKIPKNI